MYLFMYLIDTLQKSLNLFLTSGAGASVNLFLVFVTIFFFYYMRVKIREYALVFALLSVLTISYIVDINISAELFRLLGFIVLFNFLTLIYKVVIND